ncbi:MAG: hypothetical protein ACPHJ3_09315 [Rubripirellula sp.]
MPSRILLITVFCITLCFAAVATAQEGRFFSNRRYTPPNYFPATRTRTQRLSIEQMDRIYGPSILIRTQQQASDPKSAFVVQPR